jgi:hypothetical protein
MSKIKETTVRLNDWEIVAIEYALKAQLGKENIENSSLAALIRKIQEL